MTPITPEEEVKLWKQEYQEVMKTVSGQSKKITETLQENKKLRILLRELTNIYEQDKEFEKKGLFMNENNTVTDQMVQAQTLVDEPVASEKAKEDKKLAPEGENKFVGEAFEQPVELLADPIDE